MLAEQARMHAALEAETARYGTYVSTSTATTARCCVWALASTWARRCVRCRRALGCEWEGNKQGPIFALGDFVGES